MPKTKHRFIKVRCSSCKHELITFEGATTRVECPMCKNVIAQPKGGKAEIKSRIIEVLN